MIHPEIIVLELDSWDDILHLYRLADLDFVLPFSKRKIGAEDMMRSVFSQGEYLGIFKDGGLIACGGYMQLSGHNAELHGIVVHPDHRGKGVGKRITEAIIATVLRRGICQTEVRTWEGSRGEGLFLSLGFREVSRFPDPKRRPPGTMTIRMVRELTEDADVV